MAHVRTLGLLALSLAALVGCKRGGETLETPGATPSEWVREGSQTAHDHEGSGDHTLGMPGATPEEVQQNPPENQGNDEGKSSTLSTPGENQAEAKGKGLLPGTGGGPTDDNARPSQKTTPPSGEHGDLDHPLTSPGADEKEVTDDDAKTNPMGKSGASGP